MAMLAWLTRSAAVVAAIGAMVPVASCGGSQTVAHATPGPCATSDLQVALGRRIDHFTGHVARSLDFTNRSGTACALAGYPAVWFVTAPGGRRVAQSGGGAPRRANAWRPSAGDAGAGRRAVLRPEVPAAPSVGTAGRSS